MKICAISDLHGTLPSIGECDVVFICGDIFPTRIDTMTKECHEWFNGPFADWINELPCKQVFLIAGNHDFYLESELSYFGENEQHYTELSRIKRIIRENEKMKDKLVYLQDESYTLENGMKVYGTPWCISPKGFAFIDSSGKPYEEIPMDCDILLVHQPPRVGKLGCSNPNTQYEVNYASKSLANAIADRHIKYVFCGHIHSGIHGGIYVDDTKETLYPFYKDTLYYNVSIKDEEYKVRYEPTFVMI